MSPIANKGEFDVSLTSTVGVDFAARLAQGRLAQDNFQMCRSTINNGKDESLSIHSAVTVIMTFFNTSIQYVCQLLFSDIFHYSYVIHSDIRFIFFGR